MANGQENLRPVTERTKEEAREISRKGGVASGEARRRKKTIREGIKALMEAEATGGVKAAFAKNGFDVGDNYDAVVASILTRAIKGDARMIEKVLELLGEDYKKKAREAEIKIAKERLKMEKEKAAIEKEKAEAWIEAVKQSQTAEMEDDGFLEALKASAKEDWTDDSEESTI